MSPFIKSGDVLTIVLNEFTPFVGTVVVYTSKQRVLVHRIIARHKNRYVLKGDNCTQIDGIISENSFAGYVESIQRNGKCIVFGLGREKLIVALLSRFSLLVPILRVLRKLKKYFK